MFPCCSVSIVPRWPICGEGSIRLLGSIAGSPIPIVAAITGHAPAGGTVLALFCDWRVMAEGDYKSWTERSAGWNSAAAGYPGVDCSRLVGLRQAERLAVSG